MRWTNLRLTYVSFHAAAGFNLLEGWLGGVGFSPTPCDAALYLTGTETVGVPTARIYFCPPGQPSIRASLARLCERTVGRGMIPRELPTTGWSDEGRMNQVLDERKKNVTQFSLA